MFLGELALVILGTVIGSILVPYVVRVSAARNRLSALVIEMRYNRIVLKRYKRSGAGIAVVTRTAYEEFRKDYMLAREFVKDTEFHVFDRIHNAYAYHGSRLYSESVDSWEEVAARFEAADSAMMSYLRKARPRFNGLMPVFDDEFFRNIDARLGEAGQATSA